MNSFEIQCNTEGLQIDKAGINTKIHKLKRENMAILGQFWHPPLNHLDAPPFRVNYCVLLTPN